MAISFLDYEGIDPVESPRAAAAALASAKDYFAKTGGKAFLFHADSVEEFDQRAEVRDLKELLNIAGTGLGDEGTAKLLASLRREFEAAKGCPECAKCHDSGKGCVCEAGCKCKCASKRSKVAETETVHLKAKGDRPARDVKLEKGKLTREVGGKPSEHMDKVRQLAEDGHKDAQFYLNVLHH